MADDDLSKLKIPKSEAHFARSHRRRKFRWLLIPLLILLGAGLYATGIFAPAVEVELASVSLVFPSQSLTQLNASGYVVAQRKAAVASKVTGRLEWLGVEEGSLVKEGQVIARLENRDTLAAKDQAEAELQRARTEIARTQAEQHEAQVNFRRFQELLADGIISRAEFDRAEARHLQAEATVKAAEATVSTARAALRGAEVALDYTRIRAPFDAVVLTKNADIGDIVTPIGAAAEAKAAVVNIADLDSLQIEADVSESNLEKVHVGQPCEIQLDAFPERRFAGAVHMIVPTADRTKATVLVKVRFLAKDPKILPEMSARVAFLERPLTDKEQQPRTAVSRAAVVERDGKTLVFRVEGERAQASEMVTGEELGDMVEVRSGLQVGDKVIIRPLDRIREGSRVKLPRG
ncbi:MAG: efflux RND transporter periplasmic adaptor subunit [Desulfuromonas sp.]|uniref:efflux RND transporter periplasmic adaptor subunit n=1 Tax=Desulfuromonas sp. TaxID=892 RepID=UPI000CAC84A1|nr:efflux RND transporter periplasmic adaptor subunit [Desulfuromonas sp.]PLX85354.1 MAG: efflux RND transporter periplasmic adaptor subunit [Desulfuromonas sp.]